ncbi:phage tail protein, partial [Nitratireductor aquimarinus]|nr:phage tail protein [Nitratireductor aquimarinus]
FNQTYSPTNSAIHRILTQNSSDGFLRPSTPAQVAAAIAPHLSLGNDVYTGSSRDETNFPIGHIVGAAGATINRNAASAVYLSNTASQYILSSQGARLAGTWRSRGTGGATTTTPIMQRVA